jgi:hypothetical protein
MPVIRSSSGGSRVLILVAIMFSVIVTAVWLFSGLRFWQAFLICLTGYLAYAAILRLVERCEQNGDRSKGETPRDPSDAATRH